MILMRSETVEERPAYVRPVAFVADPVVVAASLRPLLENHAAACERERRIVPDRKSVV